MSHSRHRPGPPARPHPPPAPRFTRPHPLRYRPRPHHYPRPGYYNNGPQYVYVDYDAVLPYYLSAPAYEPSLPDWVGKKLIRRGSRIPSDADSGDYILESQIPLPYSIIGPTAISVGYNPNRLLIYVNSLDIVERVAYG